MLATAVCQVEFPDFEGIAHFSVLALAVEERAGWIDTELMGGECAKRTHESFVAMGALLRIQHGELERETTLHRPVALNIFQQTRCTVLEAWKGARDRTSSGRARENYPNGNLAFLLEAVGTFGPSSSGVEQGFSKSLWAISKNQLNAKTIHVEDLMKLVLDRRGEEESEVIDYARALYVKHFGETRRPPKLPRLDKGVPKSTRRPVDTEADLFLSYTPIRHRPPPPRNGSELKRNGIYVAPLVKQLQGRGGRRLSFVTDAPRYRTAWQQVPPVVLSEMPRKLTLFLGVPAIRRSWISKIRSW